MSMIPESNAFPVEGGCPTLKGSLKIFDGDGRGSEHVLAKRAQVFSRL
jgi:hypothetical protein